MHLLGAHPIEFSGKTHLEYKCIQEKKRKAKLSKLVLLKEHILGGIISVI